jgi:glycine dehydrogenase subunit 1
MPYIPHTQGDIREMLKKIGINSLDDLFSEIPKDLLVKELKNLPDGLTEMEVRNLMKCRAHKDKPGLCFIGAGAYEHYIPSVVWNIAGRGEFLTAYTPYQAEASQGTLQVIYEYQSMMCHLMELEVANASMYDGASALAEAVLMAIRANKDAKTKKVLVPFALHPFYRKAVKSVTKSHGIEIIEIAYDKKTGATCFDTIKKHAGTGFAAIVISNPNFFGTLEDVDELTNWAHAEQAIVIANVNPLATAILNAPGSWGETGADIAVGDGQPLGAPLAMGGPYFGFMCCKKDFIRQLPGRIVGRTVDTDGNPGFVLTMQVREQHIRRAKATSNICSNQALMATAATIYMSLLGVKGLEGVAIKCHENAEQLLQKLTAMKGVKVAFTGKPFFHEFVVTFEKPVKGILAKLAQLGIQGGYDLSADYPELGNSMLVCATETKTEDDLKFYQAKLEEIL